MWIASLIFDLIRDGARKKYPSRIVFLVFLCQGLPCLIFCQELWVLTDLCIYLIQVYITSLGLWIFFFLRPCLKHSVHYNAYFKMGWGTEHFMMDLLSELLWKLGQTWLSGATSLGTVKEFNSKEKFKVITFNDLNY